MVDYVDGKSLANRLYIDTDPLYVDEPTDKDVGLVSDVPQEYSNVMSDLMTEASGSKTPVDVRRREDLDAYNKAFDDDTNKQVAQFVADRFVAMAEYGINPDKAIAWANQENERLKATRGSGVYTQVKDRRLLAAAEEDPLIKSLLLGGSPEEIEAARQIESSQRSIANYQIVYNKMVEANNTYDDQGLLKKGIKGVAAYGLVPFVDNINAKRISGKLQDIFGKEFEGTWNVNTLYEKTRNVLLNASARMDENQFKDLINTIDDALLNATGLTYGDRSTFWSNVYNQNYRLNNLIFMGEVAGVGLSAFGVGKVASKVAAEGGKRAALKAGTMAALNEIMPGSQIAAMSLAKVVNIPVKAIAMKGQRKLAAKIAATEYLDDAFINTAEYGKQLNIAGRAAMEGNASALSKPIVGDAAIDISKDAAIQSADAIVASPTSIDIGLQKAAQLTEKINEGELLGNIVKDTINDAEEKFVYDYTKNLDSQRYFVSSVSSNTNGDKFTTVMEIGRSGSNKGFSNAEDAKNFAKNLSIISDDFLTHKVLDSKPEIVARSNGYFIELKRTYQTADGGVANLGELVGTKIGAEFKKGVRSEYSSNPLWSRISTTTTVPHYIRTINNAFQAAEGRTLSLLQGHLKSISKGSGPVLDKLMDITHSRNAWFTSEKLLSDGVPKNIVEAYENMRLVQDVSRMLEGQHYLKNLIDTNMKNVMSNGHRLGLGKVATDFDNKTVNVLFDFDEATGNFVTRPMKTKDDLKNATVYQMQHAINGSRYIAVYNNTLSETLPSWSDTFLSYRAGRNTFTRGSGFIKQVDISRGEKGLKEIADINTVFSHPNQASVKRVAPTLEKARQIAIRVNAGEITADEAERLFRQLPDREILKFNDFESFYKLCGKDNLISLDPEAELMFLADGQMLPDTIAGMSTREFNNSTFYTAGFSNSEKTIKKAKYTAAEILDPFNLDAAPRVSLDEEMGIEVKKILQTSTVTDYSRLFVDDFTNTFRDFIPKNMNSMDALMNKDWIKQVKDTDVRNMIENAQNTFARMKAQPTEFDDFTERLATKVANWLAPGWKAPAGSNRLGLYKQMTKLSPSKMLRAYGFHFNLGLWNPRQFYAQAMASVVAAEMSPKAAAKVTPNLFPLLGYMKSGDKSLRFRMAKKLGVKEDYIEELAEGAKRLDVWSKGSFGGAYDIAERGKSLWDDFSSTWFYDSGEHINRVYTGLLTVQEYLDKGISVRNMSKEQLLQAINRQQNLYINMSRAGSSEVQRGALGVLTQFRGYQMRALELMFDKEITKPELLRFYLTTAVLGGSKGFAGRNGAAMIHSYLEDKFGVPDYASQVVYNGALDSLVLEMGGRVSLGEFFNTSFGDLVELATETNPPSASAVWKTGGALNTLFEGFSRYGRSGETKPKAYVAAMNVFADMARKGQLPGGFKNGILGLWAYTTGDRLNNKGMLLDKDLSAFESLMIAAGLRNPMRDVEALAYEKMSRTKEKEAKYEDDLVELLTMAHRAPESLQDGYYAAANAVLSDLNEENPLMVQRVLRKYYHSYNFTNFNDDATMRAVGAMQRVMGNDGGLLRFEKELEQASERTKEK